MVGMMFKIHLSNNCLPEMEDVIFREWNGLQRNYCGPTSGMNTVNAKQTESAFLTFRGRKKLRPNVKWGENVGKGMGSFHPIAWYHNYDGGGHFTPALGISH